MHQPFEQVLKQLRIVREVDNVLRPTLAGLLMFGKYPQEFEPQLVITFATRREPKRSPVCRRSFYG